jgi:leader peptidase (prepilin peptidase)/N-methyltransferase
MNAGLVLAVVGGLLLGGLLNIVVVRLPREKHFGGWPRCTRCGQPLTRWQVIPLVGWLLQAGRASCCRKSLHWIHPLVDLLTALSCALLYLHYSVSPIFFYLVFISAILIITGAIDWLHRSIYTFVILGACLCALLASLAIPPINLLNAFAGLLIGGFVFLIFFMLARIMFPSHAAPFGLGDVYLAMFLGATFGITRLTNVLFIGMLLAGVFSIGVMIVRTIRRSTPTYIAYGTFLCLGALGYLLVRGL